MKKKQSTGKDEVLTKVVFQELWEEGMRMISAAFEKVATKKDLDRHEHILESLLSVTSVTDQKVTDIKERVDESESHEERITKLEVKMRIIT